MSSDDVALLLIAFAFLVTALLSLREILRSNRLIEDATWRLQVLNEELRELEGKDEDSPAESPPAGGDDLSRDELGPAAAYRQFPDEDHHQ